MDDVVYDELDSPTRPDEQLTSPTIAAQPASAQSPPAQPLTLSNGHSTDSPFPAPSPADNSTSTDIAAAQASSSPSHDDRNGRSPDRSPPRRPASPSDARSKRPPSPTSSVPLNPPHAVDPSLLWFRLRNVHLSAVKADVLNFLRPLVPTAIYHYLGQSGRPTGEYYVTFPAGFSSADLVALDKRDMMGRVVEVHVSSQEEERYAFRRCTGDVAKRVQEDSQLVLLNGLPYHVRELLVERWFAAAGVQIVPGGLHMPVDSLGRPNGKCLVELPSTEEMESPTAHHLSHPP